SYITEKKTDQNHDVAMEFVKRNATWYNNDTFENAQMQNFAIEYENYLVAKNPSLGVEERLRQVELEVKKKYASNPAFRNTNRDRAPAVGVNEAKPASATKSVKLSKQQEQMYQTIRQADPKYTREQYLKDME